MKITTSKDLTFRPRPRGRLIEVDFVWDDGFGSELDIVAQVETDGEHYEMIQCSHDEVSDAWYRSIKEKAEELAWLRDNPPANKRTGCDCLPTTAPRSDLAAHERDCPLRLRGEEREAFNDLVRKEARR